MAAGYCRQPFGNATASVIAGAGWSGSLRYSFTTPVTVSATRKPAGSPVSTRNFRDVVDSRSPSLTHRMTS